MRRPRRTEAHHQDGQFATDQLGSARKPGVELFAERSLRGFVRQTKTGENKLVGPQQTELLNFAQLAEVELAKRRDQFGPDRGLGLPRQPDHASDDRFRVVRIEHAILPTVNGESLQSHPRSIANVLILVAKQRSQEVNRRLRGIRGERILVAVKGLDLVAKRSQFGLTRIVAIDRSGRFLANVSNPEQFRLRAPAADGEVQRIPSRPTTASVSGSGVRDRNSSFTPL